MSKLRISIGTIIILLFCHGCIPSLHPIATEENQQADDRILGTWTGEEPIDGSIKVNFSIQGDDSLDVAEGERELELLKHELETQSEGSSWHFERVGAITFVNGSSSAKIDPAVPSLMDWKVEKIKPYNYYHLTYQHWEGIDTSTERMWCHLTEIDHTLFIDFSPSHLKNPVMNENARFATNYIAGHTFAKIEFTDNQLNLHPINSTFIEDLLKKKRIRLKHEVVDDAIVLTASTEEIRAFIKRYQRDSNLFEEVEILHHAL